MQSNAIRRGLTLLLALSLSAAAVAQGTKEKPVAKGKTSAGGALQATLEQRERAGWEAYKNKDAKAFTALCSPDYTSGLADGQGRHDLKATLDAMNSITLHRYELSNFRITPLGPNVALVTYDAQVNMAIGSGAPQDGKLYVSDLYVKRGGQWKALHYQETDVK
jgi:hypothetical protein